MAVVRFYYPRRALEGRERVPDAGRVIFVCNHPNGLLDPLLVELAMGRPVSFLAKSTFWGNPVGRLAMESFGAIAIYRSQDAGGPSRELIQKNEATFARCHEALAAGRWLALFPEGTSHSEPQLKPLKTGAARIALGAEEARAAAPGGDDGGVAGGVVLVPVGLTYEDKTTFRSGVLLTVGAPISVAARIEAHRASGTPLVEGLTEDIRGGLEDVLLQAGTRDLVEGIARVAAWTAEAPEAAGDPAGQRRRAQRLLAAYADLSARDPERLERVVRAARGYARVLRRLGVRDPWGLELERVRPGAALRALARLALAAPFALVGALMGWIPYRLSGRLANRIVRGETDILSTVKVLAGALFLLVAWTAEALAVGRHLGASWGAATFAAGPLTGYVALRFGEIAGAVSEAAHHVWLRATRARLVARVTARRRALAAEVEQALVA
jgi:1-acyl-sn-glycerol-3-phosphate acyltransferase